MAARGQARRGPTSAARRSAYACGCARCHLVGRAADHGDRPAVRMAGRVKSPGIASRDGYDRRAAVVDRKLPRPRASSSASPSRGSGPVLHRAERAAGARPRQDRHLRGAGSLVAGIGRAVLVKSSTRGWISCSSATRAPGAMCRCSTGSGSSTCRTRLARYSSTRAVRWTSVSVRRSVRWARSCPRAGAGGGGDRRRDLGGPRRLERGARGRPG